VTWNEPVEELISDALAYLRFGASAARWRGSSRLGGG
jgi:hypothetical protein